MHPQYISFIVNLYLESREREGNGPEGRGLCRGPICWSCFWVFSLRVYVIRERWLFFTGLPAAGYCICSLVLLLVYCNIFVFLLVYGYRSGKLSWYIAACIEITNWWGFCRFTRLASLHLCRHIIRLSMIWTRNLIIWRMHLRCVT